MKICFWVVVALAAATYAGAAADFGPGSWGDSRDAVTAAEGPPAGDELLPNGESSITYDVRPFAAIVARKVYHFAPDGGLYFKDYYGAGLDTFYTWSDALTAAYGPPGRDDVKILFGDKAKKEEYRAGDRATQQRDIEQQLYYLWKQWDTPSAKIILQARATNPFAPPIAVEAYLQISNPASP